MLPRFALLALMPFWAAAQSNLVSILQSEPDLSTLLEFVQLANLTDRLAAARNVTIIAPTNRAFEIKSQANDPEGIAVRERKVDSVGPLLENHVFKGYYPSERITNVPAFVYSLTSPEETNAIQPFVGYSQGGLNQLVKNGNEVNIISGEYSISKVIKGDVMAGNDVVIHVVDKVLQYYPPVLTYLSRAGLLGMNAALTKAALPFDLGLTGTEDGMAAENRDITIFVPNDAAFEGIGSVLQTANLTTLQQVLGYHIVTNDVLTSPSLTNTTVKSFQGKDLTITVTPTGDIFVDNAKIIFPNAVTFNAVVHVIDNVLNPTANFNRDTLNPSLPAAQRRAFPGASSLPLSQVGLTQLAFAEETTSAYSTPSLLATLAPISQATQTGSTSSPTGSSSPSSGNAAPTGAAQQTNAGNALSTSFFMSAALAIVLALLMVLA